VIRTAGLSAAGVAFNPNMLRHDQCRRRVPARPLAGALDFFSVGTNLLQCFLAATGATRAAPFANPLEPSFLRLLVGLCQGRAWAVVGLCGDMAGRARCGRSAAGSTAQRAHRISHEGAHQQAVGRRAAPWWNARLAPGPWRRADGRRTRHWRPLRSRARVVRVRADCRTKEGRSSRRSTFSAAPGGPHARDVEAVWRRGRTLDGFGHGFAIPRKTDAVDANSMAVVKGGVGGAHSTAMPC
jgi:hypothetical protein